VYDSAEARTKSRAIRNVQLVKMFFIFSTSFCRFLEKKIEISYQDKYFIPKLGMRQAGQLRKLINFTQLL
jgi:hypothetical protein